MNILPSSGEHRLLEIKHRLVLALYLGEGTFWVEIQDARDRWGIKPEVRWPPAHLPLPYSEDDSDKAQEWVNEMHSFQLTFDSGNWKYQRATD